MRRARLVTLLGLPAAMVAAWNWWPSEAQDPVVVLAPPTGPFPFLQPLGSNLPVGEPDTSASVPGRSTAPAAAADDADPVAATGPWKDQEPVIGSEGYGPRIETAWASNDPARAWQALRWLRGCESNALETSHMQNLRDEGGSGAEFADRRLSRLATEARWCQTVTAIHTALAPSLALMAMNGGIAHAASAYLHEVRKRDLLRDRPDELVALLRRAAVEGALVAVIEMAMNGKELGVSRQDRMAAALAISFAAEHTPRTAAVDAAASAVVQDDEAHANAKLSFLRLATGDPHITAEELAAARPLAQAIFQAMMGENSTASDPKTPPPR